jgi:hypothetical protein
LLFIQSESVICTDFLRKSFKNLRYFTKIFQKKIVRIICNEPPDAHCKHLLDLILRQIQICTFMILWSIAWKITFSNILHWIHNYNTRYNSNIKSNLFWLSKSLKSHKAVSQQNYNELNNILHLYATHSFCFLRKILQLAIK